MLLQEDKSNTNHRGGVAIDLGGGAAQAVGWVRWLPVLNTVCTKADLSQQYVTAAFVVFSV